MTPEQIIKIIVDAHRYSCGHYAGGNADGEWASIAAEKIILAIEQEKINYVKAGVELLRYAECLDGIDDDVAELAIGLVPPDGVDISMADLTVGIQKIKDSLSQPSNNSDGGLPSGRSKSCTVMSGDAGELLRHVQQDRSTVKHAPRKGNEPAMGDEQRNNSPAATVSVAGEIPHIPCELGGYTHPQVRCGCFCHKEKGVR